MHGPDESLADALASVAPGAPARITVAGRCAEALVAIARDDVTLQGATRADGLDGRLRIVGARRVVVHNPSVVNPFGTLKWYARPMPSCASIA